MGTIPSYNGDNVNAIYSRVSTVTVDSFESSSTSSEECYKNINGYATPGQCSSFTCCCQFTALLLQHELLGNVNEC